MAKLWDISLPLRTNDKGHRAIFRAATNRCVIHDMSYMHRYSIPLQLMQSHPSLAHMTSISVGTRVVDLLKFPSSPSSVVSPLYCQRESMEVFTLWLHPAFGRLVEQGLPHDISTFLDSLEAFRVTGTAWFELRGPDSAMIVLKACSSHQPMITHATSQGIDVLIDHLELARNTWRALTFSGAIAIGVLDRLSVLSEFQVPVYPFHFGPNGNKYQCKTKHMKRKNKYSFLHETEALEIWASNALTEVSGVDSSRAGARSSVSWLPNLPGNLVPMRMEFSSRGIPKAGHGVFDKTGRRFGVCLHGGFSVRLGRGAGLALVEKDYALEEKDGEVLVQRGKGKVETCRLSHLEYVCPEDPAFARVAQRMRP